MVDIKFGVQLGGTWPLGVPSGKELLDLARHVDGLGYDSVHSNDNLVSPHGGPAPVLGCMQVLSAIAAVTQQVKIGPYALQLPMYNPAVAARMMLTLDHLSGGRSLLAVSQGGAHEYEWGIVGVELAERSARQAEGLELIRKLWAEDRVTFEGDFTKMNDVNMEPKSAQPGSIPVWIGGQHSGALARAGKMGDGWAAPKVTTEFFRESSAKVLEAGTDSGRDMKDFQYVVELGIHMDQDIGKARREAARALGESKEPPTNRHVDGAVAGHWKRRRLCQPYSTVR